MFPARESEVTSPERRGFILVLGVMSLLFLAVGLAAPRPPGYVTVAQLLMPALLLVAPVLLARPLSPRAVHAVVHVFCAGVCLAFALIAWGTGGTASPYFAFTPMLPLVFTIAVPDIPLASLLAGACAGGVGLARVWVEGAAAPRALFWALAFTSTTTYAVAGAVFNRRQRARERRLVEERARAEEILAESERQRARAERLALVGELATGVAQDVTAPLSSALAAIGAIERHAGTAGGGEALAPVLSRLRASLERIRRTVDDVRSFAQADLEASEECELAVVVEEARLALEERFRAGVDVQCDGVHRVRPVRAVRCRLVQALVWIFADASGRGVRRLRVAARDDGAGVLVELADEAMGPAAAPLDLPAAVTGESGLALALAREDLLRAGCAVEEDRAGPDGRSLLRIRFAAQAGSEPRRAARAHAG